MGPLMKPEEVIRVQGKRREEEPTRCVRNALEETEVCGMLCACVHACVRACVGPLGGCRGQHPRPPARNQAHRCAAGIPTDADTPALECQRPARGQEQLLLNQGQRQPRGRVGFGGSAVWADVGAGAAGGSPLGILGQNEPGWFGEVYFGSWGDAKLSGEEKIDEAAVRVCLWLAGLKVSS